MLPLPDPVAGGSLELVRPFVNVVDDSWPLFQGWMVGALRPRGPYSILLVHGEQGSAKSTLVRIARALLDPNEAPVRREPRNGQDLIVAARNGLIVAFDNVSRLSQELSDDLARLATGAGFGARELYSDLEEVVVHVSRPIALNGIEEFAVRGDLLDRALILTLPPIEEYRDEDEFWRSFDAAHPLILGGLLDAASMALANHPTTQPPNVRMADFARWVMAAEPALDLVPGTFVAAYKENRAGAVQLTLDASPLSAPVIELASSGGFEGKATDLLALLTGLVTEEVRKQREWPKQANVLSNRLRRLAPALRRIGVFVEFSRDSRSRSLKISTRPQNIVTSVTDRHSGRCCDEGDDGDDDSQARTSLPAAQLRGAGAVRDVLLSASDYRWLATLPDSERKLVLELIRLLDTRFVDSQGSLNASFAAEFDARHVTGRVHGEQRPPGPRLACRRYCATRQDRGKGGGRGRACCSRGDPRRVSVALTGSGGEVRLCLRADVGPLGQARRTSDDVPSVGGDSFIGPTWTSSWRRQRGRE